MADFSGPIHRNHVSSAILSNAHSLTGKSIYGDVFATPSKLKAPTFSARVEDYSEIFNSSNSSPASSIPVLDLSAIDKRDVLVNVPKSEHDYSTIFGGFNNIEKDESYEDFTKPENKDCTSGEAWIPSGTSHSESDTDCPEKNQVHSQDATCQSVDCKKQFKMSYHKTNIGIRDGTNGTTHIAQLHALPGFTCMIDEIYPLQRTEGNKPVPSINGVSPTPDIGEGLMKGKHCRKAASNLPDSGSNDVALKCGRNGSCSNGMQLNAYDIDVNACHPKVMPSSSPPPNLVNNESSSKNGTASKYRTHKSDDFESATDESPIFSDEEVDTNSAAAASAAAVRKAIEMAQASIRLAKEAMEKKKGLQSSMKHCSNNGLKVKNVREIKIAAEAKRIQEKKGQEISEREKTTIQNFPNLKDWKNYYPARGAAGETNGKQSEALPVMQNKQEGKRELEAAKLSCDFINSGKYGERTLAFEEDIKEEMMQTGDGSDRERWKTTVDTFELSYSDGENSEVVEEAFVVEQFGRKLNAVNEGAQEWENHTDKLKLAENIHEQEEMEKKLKVAQKQVETKGKLKASKEPLESENESTTKKWEHNDYKKGLKESQKQLETEVKLKQAHEGDKIEKRLKEDYEIEDKEREIIELLEQEKYERIVKKACECLEDEKKPTVSCECEVNEKNLKDAHIGQDYDWGLKTVQDQELRHDDRHGGKASENRMKEDFKREGYEKMNETWMQEENDNMLEEAGRKEENERKEDAYNWEDIGLKQRHTYQREEDEKNIKATQESLTNKETYHQKTYDACKQTKSDNLCGGGETYRDKENNDNVEATQDVIAHQESWRMVEESKASSVPEENEEGSNAVDVANELADQETFGQACLDRDAIAGDDDQIETSVEDVSEAFMIDDDEVSVYKENENGLKAVNVSNEQEEKEMLETASLAGDELEHDDIENSIKDERDAFIVDDSGLNLGETNMTTEHKQIDQNNKESGSACDVGAHAEKRTHESGEIRKSAEAAEVACDQVEEINQIKAAYVDKHWVKNEKKVEASELNSVYEGKGKILEAAQEIKTSQNTEQMKENLKNTRTTEEREANESMHGNVMLEEEHLRNRDEAKEKERERDRLAVERVIREARERALADARERVENTEQMKENLKNTQITEEREARESMHKNVMLEKEHLRNRDEAKEKERERDRLAVERAIREARERAFAEARERVEKAAMEKATAEARQRVQTDVRERLDKAAAGANSLAAKVSMEAKLKAERAAVERAMAEARERAMEKALSEKAVLEAREKQNDGMPCSFSSSDQYQGAGPSSSFKHSNSSNYGVPSATERFDDGARNESAERSKARLEKHQRIVQRAAKALEEKNKRDLLAQKEQAERNRFAETLDADVKRWSSGKAGNLRSLLSTLQYILGPNSGWQPIHLTDIVTNTAVKKAYRKATLFVHPDKLQQRGASIQQKYICEKVFDLLKEAWSKFNSEEK